MTTNLRVANQATYLNWKQAKTTNQLGVWRGKQLVLLSSNDSLWKSFKWWLSEKFGLISTNHQAISALKGTFKVQRDTTEIPSLKERIKRLTEENEALKVARSEPVPLPSASLSPLPSTSTPTSPLPSSTPGATDTPSTPIPNPSVVSPTSPTAPLTPQKTLEEAIKKLPHPQTSKETLRQKAEQLFASHLSFRSCLKENKSDSTEEIATKKNHLVTLDALYQVIPTIKEWKDVDGLKPQIESLPSTLRPALNDLAKLFREAHNLKL